MASKTVNYFLVKTARVSGWLLFALVLLYIVTGFALCGEYGVEKWIDVKTALAIHKIFEWPLVFIFSVHSLVTIYFAMRRWGWTKKRARASQPAEQEAIPTPSPPRQPHVAGS
jgi:cytochrome b subunit of formate dehydrogenase